MAKTVLVSGANGDIGYAISQRVLNDGYNLIALVHQEHLLNKIEKLKKGKLQIEKINIDFRSSSEVEKKFAYLSRKYSKIDGLVNNAGIYKMIPFEKYDLVSWEEVIRINLTAPFLCVKYILPLMKKNGGKIINISSTGAHLGSRDVAYSASKAGLIGLTKSAARNLAKYKITVNAIAPGTIDTQMSRKMKPEDIDKNIEASLLKRLGKPSDVAGAVSYLLSKDADYITGFTIDVNGGLYLR